jgi:uncharacterized coiled-coil DUF342 family protein
MLRCFFKKRSAKANAKKQEKAVRKMQSVFRKVAEEHGIFQDTLSEDVTENTWVSGASFMVAGTYSFSPETLLRNHHETAEEIREMKVELDELKNEIAEKNGIIALLRNHHETTEEFREMKVELDELHAELAEKNGTIEVFRNQRETTDEKCKMRVELDELHTEMTKKDRIIDEQEEEIRQLQEDLCIAKTELINVKSVLTMKLLELRARQQDVLDKDFLIHQQQLMLHNNHNDDPIQMWSSLG